MTVESHHTQPRTTMTKYTTYRNNRFGKTKKLHPELEDPARTILERDLATMKKNGATTILRPPYTDLNEIELLKTIQSDAPDDIKAFFVTNVVPGVTNVRMPLTEKQLINFVKKHLVVAKE